MDAGRRIERFLASRLEASAAHVAKLLRQGRVRLGSRVLRRGDRLEGGEALEIDPGAAERPAPLPNRRVRLRVLHEDPDLLVISKPSGLPMHPGPGHGSDTLLNGLIAAFPELLTLGAEREYGLAHRLDLGTSGVIAVGRTPEGYTGLVEAFKARAVSKEYLAFTAGAPEGESGEVDLPVDGKDAVTRWEVFGRAGDVGRLRLLPVTGRKHQLRVHLAHLGCPVLADSRHGRGLDGLTARLYLKRLALHARALSLPHPVTGALLSFLEEPPRALRKVWGRAEKLAANQ